MWPLLCGDKEKRGVPPQKPPTGHPYPLEGLLKTGGDRRCAGTGANVVAPFGTLALGARIPQNSLCRPGKLGCSRRCMGKGGETSCPPVQTSHRATLSPKTVCSRPGGPRCNRRCVGTGEERGATLYNPNSGRHYPPKRSAQERGHSGVATAVRGREESMASPRRNVPLGIPIPHTVCSRPGGGGARVYPPLCGDEGKRWEPFASPSHWASLSPKTVCADRGGLGCIRRCAGAMAERGIPTASPPQWTPLSPKAAYPETGRLGCAPQSGNGERLSTPRKSSHGASLSPKTVQTGGTRVYPPLCGGGGKHATPQCHPPTGCPYPPKRLAQTGALGCCRQPRNPKPRSHPIG